MGLRFRKSFKVAPGVKVNLGKKSAGVSIGGKYGGVSFNTKSGARVRASAPGTGLSYSTKVGGAKQQSRNTSSQKARNASYQQPQNNSVMTRDEKCRSMAMQNNLTKESAKRYQIIFIIITITAFLIGIPTCSIGGVGAIFVIIGCVTWYFAVQYGRTKKFIERNPDYKLQPLRDQSNLEYFSSLCNDANNDVFNYENRNKCSTTYFSGLEEIESMWSVMYNLKIVNGEKADIFEAKCKNNLTDLHKMLNANKQYGYDSAMPPHVPAYVRLAMLYEKQERYKEAIDVCVEAIKAGAINDGNKGKMYGRLARLIKKSGIEVNDEILALSMKTE